MLAAVIFIISALIGVIGGLIFHYLANQSTKKSIVAGIALFILTGIGAFLTYKQSSDEPEGFGIIVRTAFRENVPSDLLTLFMIGYKENDKNILSPINFLLYLSIVNQQKVQSKIRFYRVQVAENANGPWKSLAPISLNSLNGGSLYALPGKNPIRNAKN